jgi:hypothetical protein
MRAGIPLAGRSLAEQTDNIVWWSEFDRGGHFAAMEEPDLPVGDVRAFFRTLREGRQTTVIYRERHHEPTLAVTVMGGVAHYSDAGYEVHPQEPPAR